MPVCLSRSVGLPPIFPGSASSLKTMQMEDQSGENGNRAPVSVLRRTLSAADMCSKMWKPQSGAGIKRTASVEDLQSMIHDGVEGNGSGPGSGSGSEAFEAIWSSIQKKSEAEESEQRKTTDVWGSILSEKNDVAKGGDVAPAPYVHPLVKRSASSLSEKSLEICTESLGSETGSEVFAFPESEKELIGNDVVAVTEADEMMMMMKQEPRQQEAGPTREVKLTNYSAAAGPTRSKRAVAVAGEGNGRSLPPPLPSLGNRDGGSNVQMRCHRLDGRLVVEAVSVPSRNCFKAERQGGRLLLTFSGKDSPAVEEEISDEEEEEEVTMSDEESEEVNDERGIMEKGGGMMTMTKYVDYKFFFLTRRSACSPPAPWSHRLNKVVPTPDTTDSVAKSWTTSTPPKAGGAQLIPGAGAATSLINPYVYSWRSKEMPPRGGADQEGKETVGGYGRGGCNGNLQEAPPRGTSLLFWPQTTRARCIATS